MLKTYTEKHNARRAAKKALGEFFTEADLIACPGGWTFDPDPSQAAEDRMRGEMEVACRLPAAELGGLTEAQYHEEQQAAADALARGENIDAKHDANDTRTLAEKNGVDPALWDHGVQADLDRAMTGLTAEERQDYTETQRPEIPANTTPRTWAEIYHDAAVRCLALRATETDDLVREALADAAAKYSKAMRQHQAGTAAKPPKQPRASSTNPLQKPIITSPTNTAVARLVDRIEAARGNPAALAAFTFKPSNNYYRQAHAYLEALRAEAQQQAGE